MSATDNATINIDSMLTQPSAQTVTGVNISNRDRKRCDSQQDENAITHDGSIPRRSRNVFFDVQRH
jgi:hypothetical protein